MKEETYCMTFIDMTGPKNSNKKVNKISYAKQQRNSNRDAQTEIRILYLA